jgi:hypothetical protein
MANHSQIIQLKSSESIISLHFMTIAIILLLASILPIESTMFYEISILTTDNFRGIC